MTNEERDNIIDEYKEDKERYDDICDKPHYVYVSAVLFDGKIWKWNIGMRERSISTETMIFPKELLYVDEERKERRERKDMDDMFDRRFSMLNYPIWVNNLKEHNEAFEKGREIYKNFPIHENYCMGVKPYEND